MTTDPDPYRQLLRLLRVVLVLVLLLAVLNVTTFWFLR